ncbi:MAG: WbqC family protein [Chitinophagaceae bacterium]
MIENKYFINISGYKKIVTSSCVNISSSLPYQKSLHLNRAVISGSNGPIKLNIPVIKGRNQRTPIGQVQVSFAENWRKDHWKAIVSSYNRSPWFEHYYDVMSSFYKNDFDRLFEWNLESLNIVNSILGVKTACRIIEHPEEGTRLFSGEDHSQTEKVEDFETDKSYLQVFSDRHGFLPDLSVLDLVFCAGPHRAMEYLTGT